MQDWVKKVPKAVLHDHLDGGLRVETLIELANEQGYQNLPSNNHDELKKWIQPKPDKSLAINLDISVGCFRGGTKLKEDIEKIKNGVNCIIGTPGRIIDLKERNYLSGLSACGCARERNYSSACLRLPRLPN